MDKRLEAFLLELRKEMIKKRAQAAVAGEPRHDGGDQGVRERPLLPAL